MVRFVPELLIRFSLWLLMRTIYRLRVAGRGNVPRRGPVLLVSNQLSPRDCLLIRSSAGRLIRFLVRRPSYEQPPARWLSTLIEAIPIAPGPIDALTVDQARKDLQQGYIVCIPADASASRPGEAGPVPAAIERITDGLDVPIVPVYLDAPRHIAFRSTGRPFWRRPIRCYAGVSFGGALSAKAGAAEVRQALQLLGYELAMRRPAVESLGRRFVSTAKRQWRSFSMADSTTEPMTFGRALVAALLLSRWIRRRLPGESTIGLLLPASVGGVLANLAVTLAGLVPVNLNFTAGRESMAVAVERCDIRTVISSRRFLTKAGIEALPGTIFLEDALESLASRGGRLRMFVTAWLLPAWVLSWLYVPRVEGKALATVIFSSGSTGTPKGVMLSHANILSNVDSINRVCELTSGDVLMGVLPLFHSFGFTGTLWLPAITGFGAVYHPNPMDAKTVGDLAGQYRATVLISTPTFASSYVRKCEPDQFSHLRYAIVGAERLREVVAAAFNEKFGIDLLEGYGCTEMAPVVAVNVPADGDDSDWQRGTRAGTVGRPLPGIAAMVVDTATGEGPLFGSEGLLLVKGPNRMIGYLGQPELTAEVFRDGWYVTGDIAAIEEGGFIRITDRLARFSKIAGEMVPHMRVEEQIQALLHTQCTAVVTGIPDAAKGERLVAFYTDPDVTPRQLWECLSESALPRLWLPKREDLCFVESIPTLGTGKVDLRGVRDLALARATESAATSRG